MNGYPLIDGLLLVSLSLQKHVMNHLQTNTSPSLCCRHMKCAADRRSVFIYTKKLNKVYCTTSSSTQISNNISKVDNTTSTAYFKILRPHISEKKD